MLDSYPDGSRGSLRYFKHYDQETKEITTYLFYITSTSSETVRDDQGIVTFQHKLAR